MDESRIVEAVGSAVTSNSNAAQRMQDAMVEALKIAQAANITDVDELRKVQMEARQRVKDELKQEASMSITESSEK